MAGLERDYGGGIRFEFDQNTLYRNSQNKHKNKTKGGGININ